MERRPFFPSTPNERNPMKAIAALLSASVLALLAGCNTVEGVGQDVQAGGRTIERAADKSNPTEPPGTRK
jgi:predicted small secreted protein